MHPALAWAAARPLHAAALVLVGIPAAFLSTPLLLGIAAFTAPVLVPALLFCVVSWGRAGRSGAALHALLDAGRQGLQPLRSPLQALWWLTGPAEPPPAAAAASRGEPLCMRPVLLLLFLAPLNVWAAACSLFPHPLPAEMLGRLLGGCCRRTSAACSRSDTRGGSSTGHPAAASR